MRKAKVFVNGVFAGILEEGDDKTYRFLYDEGYSITPVSLTMPIVKKEFLFKEFPPFFDGLLPEGMQLEGLLRAKKIDRSDYFSQLIAVGKEVVGAVTIEETE